MLSLWKYLLATQHNEDANSVIVRYSGSASSLLAPGYSNKSRHDNNFSFF